MTHVGDMTPEDTCKTVVTIMDTIGWQHPQAFESEEEALAFIEHAATQVLNEEK